MLSKIAVPSVGRVAQARVKIDSAPIPAAKAVHLLPQTTLVDAALTSDRTSDLNVLLKTPGINEHLTKPVDCVSVGLGCEPTNEAVAFVQP
jgi:hypothetical protein